MNCDGNGLGVFQAARMRKAHRYTSFDQSDVSSGDAQLDCLMSAYVVKLGEVRPPQSKGLG